MGYPARLLSDDEIIESQFRPHWSGILREGLIVLGGIILAVVLYIVGVDLWVYLVLAAVVLALIASGVVKWANTLHVITNERLIYRAGFIAKQGTELPLEVIQNVAFNQSIIERIFGTGDLMIESAGTHGQTRYRDIPNPEGVQSLIYRMREIRMQEMENGGQARQSPVEEESEESSDEGETPADVSRAGGGRTIAEQLEILARLHDQGKLTDAEFATEKARVLGGGS